MRALQLDGRRFGRLVAQARVDGPPGLPTWRCGCDCGGTKDVAAKHLNAGVVQSCGCIVRTHGDSAGGKRTRVYMAWDSMRRRCGNAKHPAFAAYGGRGIAVCERWQTYPNFLADMGKPPAGASLDRIDNSLGYEPGNCRWASAKDQNRNKRDNRMVTLNGATKSVAEWSEERGWPHHVIASRLRAGWAAERALTEPVRAKRTPNDMRAHVERALEFDR